MRGLALSAGGTLEDPSQARSDQSMYYPSSYCLFLDGLNIGLLLVCIHRSNKLVQVANGRTINILLHYLEDLLVQYIKLLTQSPYVPPSLH